jgi:hypothetical protein
MASGQVVLVTTEGLSGGPPMRTVYYVAEEDPAKAEAIIAKFMAPNEKVEAFGRLPEAAVKGLRLQVSSYTHELAIADYGARYFRRGRHQRTLVHKHSEAIDR